MHLLKKLSKFTTRRVLLQLVVLVIAIFILWPQLDEFLQTPLQVTQLNLAWIIVAATALAMTYVAAASVYVALLRPVLSLGRTIIAQLATSFTNRLLPGGIGGMGTYVRFLHSQKVSNAQSAVVVGANQLIGTVSFMLLAIMLGLTARQGEARINLSHKGVMGVLLVAAVVIVATIVLRLSVPAIGKKITHFYVQSWRSIMRLARRPIHSLQALVATSSLTLCYAVCLYACLMAIGVQLDLRQVLLVYMGGSVAGSVAPTPGGLGAIEAALVAGLRASGVDPAPAVSAVLIYRIISFWLPIIPGYLAFRWLLAKRYI